MKMNWLDPDTKNRTDERHELPDVITPDFGLGITFKDDKGIEYTTAQYPGQEVRIIRFEATTYVGISMDAEHYYGKLTVYGFPFKFQEDGEEKLYSIGGYFTKFVPDDAQSFEIKILRPLTESEIKNGSRYDPDRWKNGGYRVGSLVNAFDTQKQLYNAMVECIKARFSGEWLVNIDGFDDRTLNKRDIPLSSLEKI